ncbi:heterokaryon incompatibility protein-domain-containing protein [Xylaria curta]|nr:heterokaryon incompatibility protein-domain-containing protein [Xylaria curta]
MRQRFYATIFGLKSKFVYPPLIEEDGIRILLLQPAISRDAELRGTLQHISFAQQCDDLVESYTALSYVWGDPTPVDRILIDGKKLGITANLGAALRDLRDNSRIHRLWADAICIDQGNIPERSKQVTRMGEIYGRANNTVIYLGPSNPHTDAIIELAKRCAHLNDPESDAISPRVPCKDGGGLTSDIISLVDAALKDLLTNPWFQRIWVLQELVLSRVPWVQCGLKRVRWADLCHVLVPWLETYRHEKNQSQKNRTAQGDRPNEENEDNDAITALECMNNIRTAYHSLSNSSKPSKLTLWQILQSRKGCQVSDPRDIIFAHMGIISDRHIAERFIKVDYGQTTLETFVAMGYYVRYCGHINAMFDRSAPSTLTKVFSLPSWVPHLGIELDPRRHCLETKMLAPHNPANVLPLLTQWSGEILELSDILPALLSLESIEDFSDDLTWGSLPATTTEDDSSGRLFLQEWISKAALLQDKERRIILTETIRYLYQYASADDNLGRSCTRFALLDNGVMIVVPYGASMGDIVVRLADKQRDAYNNIATITAPLNTNLAPQSCTLVVRRCEPYRPTDLKSALRCLEAFEAEDYNGVELQDISPEYCLFQHASLIGVCNLWLDSEISKRHQKLDKFRLPILVLH